MSKKIISSGGGGGRQGFYSGGGGVSKFTDLSDAPHSYSGEAGKVVVVKGTEDGLEFVTEPAIDDHKVLMNNVDPSADFLINKLEAGTGISIVADNVTHKAQIINTGSSSYADPQDVGTSRWFPIAKITINGVGGFSNAAGSVRLLFSTGGNGGLAFEYASAQISFEAICSIMSNPPDVTLLSDITGGYFKRDYFKAVLTNSAANLKEITLFCNMLNDFSTICYTPYNISTGLITPGGVGSASVYIYPSNTPGLVSLPVGTTYNCDCPLWIDPKAGLSSPELNINWILNLWANATLSTASDSYFNLLSTNNASVSEFQARNNALCQGFLNIYGSAAAGLYDGISLASAVTIGARNSATGLFLISDNTIYLGANASVKLKINSSGLTVPAFSVAGFVKNNASGLLSSGLIASADLPFQQDLTGTTDAHINLITSNNAGESEFQARNNALCQGFLNIYGSAAAGLYDGISLASAVTIGARNSATGLFLISDNTIYLGANASVKLKINSSGLTVPAFSVAGFVKNNASGLLSSGTIGASDLPDHALGGSQHSADTIANIQSKVSGGSLFTTAAAEISALTEKAAPVGADLLLIEDSAATNAKKKVQITNLPFYTGSLSAGMIPKIPPSGYGLLSSLLSDNGTSITNTGNLYNQGDVYTVAWTDYFSTSTKTGWTSPSGNVWYKRVGNTVYVEFGIVGTSNATSASFTLPYTNNGTNLRLPGRVKDNGGNHVVGAVKMDDGSATCSCYCDMESGAFTNSGTKEVQGNFFYRTTQAV